MKAKTIKLFGIIMMLVMGMSFNACSSDDDNDDDGGDVRTGLLDIIQMAQHKHLILISLMRP